MIKRSVTQRDVARQTGHHYSTVSLALRGEPRLPPATIATIVQAAKAMGYTPDPMLKALSAYRTAIRPASYHATLALLVNDARSVFRSDYSFRQFILGTQQRASELGYKIEEFLFRAPRMTAPRMVAMLQNRGISGILVAAQPPEKAQAAINMDWSGFASVNFGYTLSAPRLHSVAHHHFLGVQMTMDHLLSLGYRRIGLCVHRLWSDRTKGNWIGGYLAKSMMGPLATRIEPLLVHDWERIRVKKWMLTNKLDAVIVDDSRFVDWMRADLKLEIPEEIGVASLEVYPEDMSSSGVNQNMEEIGRCAVNLLVSLLHSGERGAPVTPQNLLIEGSWREGNTLRHIDSTATRACNKTKRLRA